MSTPPSTLTLSISVIQVMNTPLRDIPSLKERRAIHTESMRVLHVHVYTHTHIHKRAHTHIHIHTNTCLHPQACTHFTDSLAHDHQRCLDLLLLLLHLPHHLQHGVNWRTALPWPGAEVEQGHLKGRLKALQTTDREEKQVQHILIPSFTSRSTCVWHCILKQSFGKSVHTHTHTHTYADTKHSSDDKWQ